MCEVLRFLVRQIFYAPRDPDSDAPVTQECEPSEAANRDFLTSGLPCTARSIPSSFKQT